MPHVQPIIYPFVKLSFLVSWYPFVLCPRLFTAMRTSWREGRAQIIADTRKASQVNFLGCCYWWQIRGKKLYSYQKRHLIKQILRRYEYIHPWNLPKKAPENARRFFQRHPNKVAGADEKDGGNVTNENSSSWVDVAGGCRLYKLHMGVS